jgi:stage V sporulation protein B
MILRRLQSIGYNSAGANALYGNYTTMVVPIFNLIPSLITSVALALVPTLTAAIKAGDTLAQQTTARTAIRLTALLSLPASLALAIYSRAVLSLLFRGQQVAVEQAAPMLSLLSMSVFFSAVITTTNAILQAYGRVHAPIVSMLTGSILKLITAYVLIGIPRINIYGAPISTFACDALIVGINLCLIAKHTDVLESLKTALLRPLGAATVSVGLPGLAYALFTRAGYSEILLFFAAVPVTLVLYLLVCLRSGLLGEYELSMLPSSLSGLVLRLCRCTKKETGESGRARP